jgi:hypothetical protein
MLSFMSWIHRYYAALAVSRRPYQIDPLSTKITPDTETLFPIFFPVIHNLIVFHSKDVAC